MDSLKQLFDFGRLIAEKIKITYLCSSVVFVAVTLFLLPDKLAMAVNLYSIRADYSGYINLAALFACAMLLLTSASKIYRTYEKRLNNHVVNKKIKDKLAVLNDNEKELLKKYIGPDGKVNEIAYFDEKDNKIIEFQFYGILRLVYNGTEPVRKVLHTRNFRTATAYRIDALVIPFIEEMAKEQIKNIDQETSEINYSEMTSSASQYWKNGCYDLAIAEYTKLLESEELTDEIRAALYYDRGTCHSDASNYPSALEDLTKAIEIAPNYLGAYNNRGNVFKKMKEYDKAISDHTQAIGLNPNDGFIRFNRGTTYFNTGRKKDSLSDFYHGFRLQPLYGLKVFSPLILYGIYSAIKYILNTYYK